jgi:hypothetical protein
MPAASLTAASFMKNTAIAVEYREADALAMDVAPPMQWPSMAALMGTRQRAKANKPS